MIAACSGYVVHSSVSNRTMSLVQVSISIAIFILNAIAYSYLLREDGLLDLDTPAVFIVFRMDWYLASLAIFALANSLAMTRHQ